ncbi:MAG: hypothetical protein FWE45_01015 [Firmicutes bacterium]|nr:hypothetical protein [Bacillota bacterium]
MNKVVSIKIGDINPAQKFATDLELNVGDIVITESPNGAEWGVVATPVGDCGKTDKFANIIRVANSTDEKVIEKLKLDAKTALRVSQEKAETGKLDMKFLSAYYTLDGGKVILQFSSPGRIDFRELVRDLAFALKARIELRQIGARDEVKLAGAMGPCGQVCCCVRYKEDFENVTIKMAKNQNLSLNPQKINGMCGRLLCCLAYENAHYVEMGEKMPKYGQEVNTPDGKGIAQGNNMLTEKVNVKFQSGDTTKYGTYKLCDINCKGCKK